MLTGSADEILTLDELCAWLKLKKDYVYHLTCQQAIPHLKIGRQLRFRRSEIEDWLTTRAHQPVTIELSLYR